MKVIGLREHRPWPLRLWQKFCSLLSRVKLVQAVRCIQSGPEMMTHLRGTSNNRSSGCSLLFKIVRDGFKEYSVYCAMQRAKRNHKQILTKDFRSKNLSQKKMPL